MSTTDEPQAAYNTFGPPPSVANTFGPASPAEGEYLPIEFGTAGNIEFAISAPPTDTPAPTGGETLSDAEREDLFRAAKAADTVLRYRPDTEINTSMACKLFTAEWTPARALQVLAEATTLRARLQEETRAAAEAKEDRLEMLGEIAEARQLLANADFYLSTSMRFKSSAEEYDAINLDARIQEFLSETAAAYGQATPAQTLYPKPKPAALPLQGEEGKEVAGFPGGNAAGFERIRQALSARCKTCSGTVNAFGACPKCDPECFPAD